MAPPTIPAMPTTSTSPMAPSLANHNEVVVPYTHGLTGVNIFVDNLSRRATPHPPLPDLSITNDLVSHILYALLAVLFLGIVLVRLGQSIQAHLRHLDGLRSRSADEQRYWTQDHGTWWPFLKKHLFYAPLLHKRHNREIQLSNAINVGTIPSRFHTLILLLYLIANFIYCLLLDYHNPKRPALIAEIRGRTGHLAVINMVCLFVLAGRNNPLIRILRVSFDTMNLFHRWIGRLVVVLSLAHLTAWAVNKKHAEGMNSLWYAMRTDAFIIWGTVAVISMTTILIQAPSAVRHAAYETFLHLHQFLAFLALLGVYLHVQLECLPQMPYMVAIILIWSWDRLARWARIIYYNVSWSRGITTVKVEALPGDACRVTFDLRRSWTVKPGCHVYVYLPRISFWMSHPFSMAWTETRPIHAETGLEKRISSPLPQSSYDLSELPSPKEKGKGSKLPIKLPHSQTRTSVSLVIAKRTGMTAKLYDTAHAGPNHTIYLRGFLEGPYGGLESLHSYGTVVLFAGGAGITNQLLHIRTLLEAYPIKCTANRKIVLVWSVRSADMLEWVRPWMDKILAMPGRREVLRIEIFVTKPKKGSEMASSSERCTMNAGRANASIICKREFENRSGAMCVGVCGPGAFADDVRAAVRSLDDGVVDFWEEGFTW